MTEATQYVTLGIDREVFGVPVAGVREILDMRPVARLPHAPPHLLGMIDVRGQGVPVIDLRAKLGLPTTETTPDTRILVIEVAAGEGPAGEGSAGERPLVVGLVADRVFEVTALDGGRLEPPPEIGIRWRSECIGGVGRRGDAFVVVFDLARLFASDEVLLPAAGEAGTGPATAAA